VEQQGLKVPREYKVNPEKLERLISGGGKRPVQILELHWSMKVTIKLFVSCHRGCSTYIIGEGGYLYAKYKFQL
jgi:hypothetical protein